ncbi:hypothetical protein Dimus_011807 [Dionaea muscipula]
MSLQCYPDIPPFSFVFDIFLHVPGRGEESKQKHKVPSLKLPTPANSRFLLLIIKTPPPQKKRNKAASAIYCYHCPALFLSSTLSCIKLAVFQIRARYSPPSSNSQICIKLLKFVEPISNCVLCVI